MKQEIIQKILDKHSESGDSLISILEDIQAKYNYLPEEALKMVSEDRKLSLVDIFSVATFYKAFSLKPRGKHLISVCLGTACHVRGGPVVAKEFQSQLCIKPGETTADQEYTLETVNCLGACALGPVVVVDGHYFSKVRKSKVRHIIKETLTGFDAEEIKQDYHIFPVEVSCPRCNHSFMDTTSIIDFYPSIKVTASYGNQLSWLRLSSMYGSYNVFSEHEIPEDTILHFFCPHCHAELVGAGLCPVCNAPMVPMIIRGGGMLQICSRRGCKHHLLDLV
ncbi:MAG: NAD(P)H-dependent oxidoreductase subunit E [bacterium]